MIVTGIVLAAAVGGLGYYYYYLRPAPAPPAQRSVIASEQAVAPQPPTPTLTGDNIDLPPLPETDSLIRDLVSRLSSHPTVAAWLTTKGLISNFTVVTLTIAEGHAPTSFLRAVAPRARFRTQGSAGNLFLDPRSYDRYNPYAEAVSGLDATATARLYLTVKPRIQDAYSELGYPNGDFDQVLARATRELLSAPVPEGPIALRQQIMSYAFADPELESKSAAQKQFMRMGPENMRTVQAKVREIAALLNLPQKE